MNHEPDDDFSFLDGMEETDVLGELLGSPPANSGSSTTDKAAKASSTSEHAEVEPTRATVEDDAPHEEPSRPVDTRHVNERPLALVLTAMPWNGVVRDAAAHAAPSAIEEDRLTKDDLGENYLQSISW